MELLGGRMWLESEVGVGSTFGFSLPDRDAQAHRAAASSRRPAHRRSRGRHRGRPAVAGTLTVYLVGTAAEVTVARDGPSGLDAVRRVHPAVVLLDIRLPGIDGWAVLEALKSDTETRDIPVIVVSIIDERARGVALGAEAYLVKPVRRDDLLAALRTVSPAADSNREDDELEGGR